MNISREASSGRRRVRLAPFAPVLTGLCGLLFAAISPAQTPGVITLTFDGLKDAEFINNYYNGGYALSFDPLSGLPAGNGSGPGPNYGVTFGSDSLALVSLSANGSGDFSGNPSGNTIAFFLSGPGVIMNVAAGFQTGFAFYFTSAQYTGTVTVYSGIGATGTVLAQISLPSTGTPCNGSIYTYSCWQKIGATFSGTARSVNFSGVANQIGFDNITLGAGVATPPLVISTASLAAGTVGTAYSATLAATGGTLPYTWTATGLPPGLTVSNGVISGTPTSPGTYPVILKVTDNTSPALSATSLAINLVINSTPIKVTCGAPNPTYTPGTQFSTTCTASGGVTPYAWSFTGLPSWLRNSATTGASITLSGTVPAAPPNSYSVTVTLSDGTTPNRQTASTTLSINLATWTVSCTPQSGSFAVGAAYSATCTATGGTAPYTWSLSSVPSWLKSSGTTGASITLTGTFPAPPSVYSVGVTVTDSSTPAKQSVSTTITISPLALTLSCVPQSGSFTAGAQYSATCTASAGSGPYAWTFSTLPAWLKSSAVIGASITLSGTVPDPPPGTYSVGVTVTDTTGAASQTTTLTINVTVRALTVSCAPQTGSYAGNAQYSATCTANGGTAPYNWTFASLPAWLKSSATTGATITLSGTVPASPPPSYSSTVTVTDSTAATKQTASSTLTINVAAPLVLSCSTTNGPAISGIPYTATCTVSGGAAPYTFSLGGSLPPGLTASPGTTTYTISGTPTAAGGYNYAVQLRDSAGQNAQQAFSGTLSAPPSISTFNLTAVPGVSQFTATLTLSNPAPTTLSGTLCLTFAADPSVGNAASYQSQEVVFANGTTSSRVQFHA